METKSEKSESEKIKKTDWEFYAQVALVVVLAGILLYSYSGGGNQGGTGAATGIGTVSALDVLPKGVPDIYGSEIGISYNDVSASNPSLADATMAKLTAYEDIELNSEQMERYVRIGSSIACEYCCGAKTLVFSTGERACGCAHSYAMRGLAKYLLTEHPDIADLEILEELGKWKVLFFPGIHEKKDVDIALKLGCVGVLIASGVVKAKDPKKVLEELTN